MELMQVIDQIGREKGIEREVLIDAVGAAILSASRKTLGTALDLRIDFDAPSGQFKLSSVKKVVEAVTNPKVEISLAEARGINLEASLGDEVHQEMPMSTQGFGRIAAQTAKQVIIQRVREAERDSLYQSYKDKEGELVHGVVQRVVKGNVIVNLGRAEAILPHREQLPREDYRVGDRVRACIVDVKKTSKGSQIIVSRTHPDFLRRLFELEVPEIYEGIVEIRAAAREPGERAKIAVASKDNNVDPVGACVGYRGARVQAIVRELQGEKIDIIPWRADPVAFVKSSLGPADVQSVTADETYHTLVVIVADDQLSLAIGKRGQNARLAAKLVGWKVDIKSYAELAKAAQAALPEVAAVGAPEGEAPAGEYPEAPAAVGAAEVAGAAPGAPGPAAGAAEALRALTALPGVGEKTAERLLAAGFRDVARIAEADGEALQQVEGIGPKTAVKLIAAAREAQARGG